VSDLLSTSSSRSSPSQPRNAAEQPALDHAPSVGRIERLAEKIAFQNDHVTVFVDAVVFPNGKGGSYVRVQIADGHPGVVVLPLFPDGQIGLVRQHRYPIGQALWELPRRTAHSADLRAEAARELEEETGAAGQLIDLGMVYPDSGTLTTKVTLFATLLTASERFTATAEIDAVRRVTPEKLFEMIGAGEIVDAFTICAATRAHLHGLLDRQPPIWPLPAGGAS
jgi:ADP-ribose pyrophosphatase